MLTNEVIAEKVMGWHFDKHEDNLWWFRGDKTMSATAQATKNLPNFLTDMNAAMMVIEKMRNDGYRYKIYGSTLFNDNNVKFFIDDSDVPDGSSINKSLPNAICAAALKAIQEEC